MFASLKTHLASQSETSFGGEGLPYWIFWFLLCIILLLVTFIFLRDKELRRRLNIFFIGAKKKSIRFRLRLKVKKERQKKEALWRELGEKAWGDDIRVPESENTIRELEALDKKKQLSRLEWEKAVSEIRALNVKLLESIAENRRKTKEQETARVPHEESLRALQESERRAAKTAAGLPGEMTSDDRQREQEELRNRIDALNQTIKTIEAEARRQKRETEKEIREEEKIKERIQQRIRDYDHSREHLLFSLGKLLDALRTEDPRLTLIYSRIDEVDRRISHLEHRIDSLSL